MGLTFTKLFQRLFSKKEMRILMASRHSRKDPRLVSPRESGALVGFSVYAG
jgi:hypothetical protein